MALFGSWNMHKIITPMFGQLETSIDFSIDWICIYCSGHEYVYKHSLHLFLLQGVKSFSQSVSVTATSKHQRSMGQPTVTIETTSKTSMPSPAMMTSMPVTTIAGETKQNGHPTTWAQIHGSTYWRIMRFWSPVFRFFWASTDFQIYFSWVKNILKPIEERLMVLD